MAPQTVLVIDTASPIVSLAIARQGQVLAAATLELRRTSERLLATVNELLEGTNLRLDALTGVATLQGPGSFTGLRIGLATVLGWHQGLGLRATALPTLPILAAAGVLKNGIVDGEVVAAVNAMRGDWMVQRFAVGDSVKAPESEHPAVVPWPTPLDTARLLSFEDFATLGEVPIVGFELPASEDLDLRAAPPLAPTAAELLSMARSEPASQDTTSQEGRTGVWEPSRLIQPIYFRPPAVTPAKPKTP